MPTTRELKPPPRLQSNVPTHHRIHRIVHVQVIKHLSGGGLEPLVNRLMKNISRQLATSGITNEWLDMPDLYEFCQVKLLPASLDAMFGPYRTAINHHFITDYWKFDKCTPYLLKVFPRFLIPGSWSARQKCLESLKAYSDYVGKLYDIDGKPKCKGVDTSFGMEFIMQRKRAFSKMEPMNPDSIARTDQRRPEVFW